MAETSVVLAALIGGGLGGAILLLIVGVRGTVKDPTAPPSRFVRWIEAQRSPFLAVRLVGALVLGVLVFVVTRWPVAAFGLGGMVALWPALVGGSRVEQTQIARLEALVSWTEALRDTISAHAGLEQAIPATAETAAPIIRPALLRMVGHIRTHLPLEDVLQDLAEQLDHSADMIIAALINNVKRRGDGLVQVLTGLAIASREELDMRRKITAGRAGDRRAVQLMLLIVLGVASFLVLFNGGTYTAPYRTVSGQVALAVAMALFATSFLWIRKLAASKPPNRFLPRAGQHMDSIELQIIANLTGGKSDVATADAQELDTEARR